MKPVVSSIIALALAIVPMTAMAKPHKAAHAKVVNHHKQKAEPAAAAEGAEKASAVVRVKADHKKNGAAIKPAVHHAHNVDLGGPGHKEPKVDHGGAIVTASMTSGTHAATPTKVPTHGKPVHTKPGAKPADLPKLPTPNAGKPSKGGAEKGAKKPAEKKHETANDANDGEPTRDEDFAELVARIRGHQNASPVPSEDSAGIAQDTSAPAQDTRGAKNASHTSHGRALGTPTSPVFNSKRSDPPCSKDPVEIVRGPEVERFELTKCDGTVAPLAVEHLSILIRPGGAARPVAPLAELAKKPGPDIGHGIRRADPRLVERIQSLADHFGKPGAPAKLFVISGYRPTSVGSMHSTGRAIDFRVEGAKNEDVVAFCKTLTDTGCGFYPNSSFVHVDVRDVGAGHVTWIDASGPGETPRYVAAWPPPSTTKHKLDRVSTQDLAEEGANLLRAKRPLDRESVPEAVDEHPADVAP
jgi:hypothetical protein